MQYRSVESLNGWSAPLIAFINLDRKAMRQEHKYVQYKGKGQLVEKTVDMDEGKYQVHKMHDDNLIATRYNEVWDAFGDTPIWSNLTIAMFNKIQELQSEVAELEYRINNI